MFANSVAVHVAQGGDLALATFCEQQLLALSRLDTDAAFVLQFDPNTVALVNREGPESPLMVDFAAGAVDHRRRFGGGKGQDIAKAVGLNKGVTPRVIDATAGLGRDAFVLASLGCSVHMLERSPVVYALLVDGLRRAQTVGEVAEIAKQMSLSFGSLLDIPPENELPIADVVYLDPMFPERSKSALVKKDMRFFHSVVGDDPDADGLLSAALALDVARVVVKRPLKAPFLDGAKPAHQIVGKSIRYDIYVKRKLSGG